MSVIGKPSKDEYSREEALEIAAKAAKKNHLLMSKRKAERIAVESEHKYRKRKGLGI